MDEIQNGMALFLAANYKLLVWLPVQSQNVPAFLSVLDFIPSCIHFNKIFLHFYSVLQ